MSVKYYNYPADKDVQLSAHFKMGEFGVPMPPFLVRTVKNLKGKVDDATGKHFAEEDDSKHKED